MESEQQEPLHSQPTSTPRKNQDSSTQNTRIINLSHTEIDICAKGLNTCLEKQFGKILMYAELKKIFHILHLKEYFHN